MVKALSHGLKDSEFESQTYRAVWMLSNPLNPKLLSNIMPQKYLGAGKLLHMGVQTPFKQHTNVFE